LLRNNPQLAYSYREIAEMTEISLGAARSIVKKLLAENKIQRYEVQTQQSGIRKTIAHFAWKEGENDKERD